MTTKYFFLIILLALGSCKDESPDAEIISDDQNFFTTTDNTENDANVIVVTTLFDEESFPDPEMPALLTEIKICNPLINDSIIDGVVPCSPKYFKFYTYNRKRSLEDAFLLQVRKGVNNYPFRRLLIFTRENDQLVLMNGIRGYLVEKRKSESGLDDLVVALVDNLEGEYMRYDVLLRYENGKYHYVEALGDIYGSFEGKPKMKAAAFEEIGERIKSEQLIF
jgi:hypothetical protein